MPKWLTRLEYRFRRFGIDNLMLYITGTMLAVYLAEGFLGLPVSEYLVLGRDAVFHGEVWRLITFIVVPPHNQNVFFVIISLYFYYFIGSSLENAWGSSKFTLFYIFGVVGAIIAAMLTGYGDNTYLNLSMFLAFAALAPNHQILLFFILPVKVKYLAYFSLALLGISFIFSGWSGKAAILLSFLNLALFFSDDFIDRFNNWKRYGKQRRNFRKTMKRQRDIYGN